MSTRLRKKKKIHLLYPIFRSVCVIMQISTLDYAPFVHVNKLQTTCNTFFVCLDASIQISDFHDDV